MPGLRKKKVRAHPGREQLRLEEQRSVPVEEVVDKLVSPRTGIVSEFRVASRDATEPHRPLVWRAKLANSRVRGRARRQPSLLLRQGLQHAGRLVVLHRRGRRALLGWTLGLGRADAAARAQL